MKRIYSSHDLLAVHHAKNVLEAAGIRAVVKNEILSSAMGELPPAECLAEVWVRRADAERAEKVLNQAPADETPWQCASCGERQEPQFTQCWKCGKYRDSK